MSILNSKFDIVSVDNPVALAALAQVLAIPGGMTLNSEGTPVAGVIPAGAIVTMNGSGEAVLATTGDVANDGVAKKLNMQMVFVAIDGNKDFSGSFVQKLTVLNGGFTMKTDQYDAGGYQPGNLVTFNAGKIKLADAGGQQVIGVVGPSGLDAVNGILEVIVPQGIGA
jgi:hypothetical protein